MNKIEELAMNDLKETRSWKANNYMMIIEEYRTLLAHYGMIATKGNAHQLQDKMGITRTMISKWLGIGARQWKKYHLKDCREIDFDKFCAKRSVDVLVKSMGLKILDEFNGNQTQAQNETGIPRTKIKRWANKKID